MRNDPRVLKSSSRGDGNTELLSGTLKVLTTCVSYSEITIAKRVFQIRGKLFISDKLKEAYGH